MQKVTIMLIPDGGNACKQFKVSTGWLYVILFIMVPSSFATAFFARDYLELKRVHKDYLNVIKENESYRGEAKVVVAELDEVKKSLKRVQDFSNKLQEIVSLQTNTVAKQTGIGPLSDEEYDQFRKGNGETLVASNSQSLSSLPLGINLDRLNFKPVFDKMSETRIQSDNQAIDMQRLLTRVNQQKYLLNSIPSILPVDGWVTSNFGRRVSPFTGQLSSHQGLDVASPIGTPIHTPADGVVIFSGKKSGYGNFVMIAHGYGIVTRYGHNAQNLAQPGQKVKRGEQIATVGDTGRSTGPHLHYEVWVNGSPVNPEKFILNLP
jgi:murein DD-endopeptidase MepM/ murein hydrolase activator NlpD